MTKTRAQQTWEHVNKSKTIETTKTKVEHTKLEYRMGQDGHTDILDQYGVKIAAVYISEYGHAMAAALELLEVLEECEIALRIYDQPPHVSVANKRIALERAQAAIRKAKGEL